MQETDLCVEELRHTGINPPTICNKKSKAVSIAREVLLAFSVVRNARSIFSLNVGQDTLAPIHGLRLISMLWVILVHTCLILFFIADNKKYRSQAEGNFLFQTLTGAAYAVDTFFFISGSLVSYLYYRTCAKYTMKELMNIDAVLGQQLIQFISLIVYRYLRLTPPYLFVLCAVYLSMKHFDSHSVIQMQLVDHINCPNYWWRNALYINTLYPLKESCMAWSWYLADDTQFYTIGIIALIISLTYFRLAVGAVLVFLLSSWSITAAISLSRQHNPSIQDPFANYDELYNKPWTRIGPYLVGMSTGWFLFKTNCKLRMNYVVLGMGWFVSLSLLTAIVYGLHFIKLGPISAAVHTSLSHTVWAFCLAWVLIACMTGNGGWVNSILSWKYLYPFSRITYCAYLLHPQLIRITILGSDSPTHISRDLVATLYFGFVVVTYVFGLVVSLTFEAPCVALLRILHPIRRHQQT